MPSESVAGFLDHAKASRVLFPEQLEQLIRQPDMPQSDLTALCEFLQSRGVLTRFQAAAIRDHRGSDLNYGGYPIIDELGPCPGGTAYRALHPSLRTPIILRRIRADWLNPSDNATNFLNRARGLGMIAHPNVVSLLDAGIYGDEIYLVIDFPADSADLEALAKEIGGAMPGFLAAEYGRAVASALRSAHERGGAHGDVRPSNLVIGPLAIKTNSQGHQKRRPAPDAVVRLAELGLVPIRPPASAVPGDANPYLSPERLDAQTQDARGDIYSLGATLYFLLAGRPPFAVDDPDLLGKIRSGTPTSLGSLRPDLPPEFVALVSKMMEKDPGQRPPSAYEVESALVRFCRPGTVPPQPGTVPVAVPASVVGFNQSSQPAQPAPVLVAVPDEAPAADANDGWGVSPSAFDQAHSEASAAPRQQRQMSSAERGRGKMLMIFGGLLHLTAITMLVLWLTGTFDSIFEPDAPPNETKPSKKTDGNKTIKKGKG